MWPCSAARSPPGGETLAAIHSYAPMPARRPGVPVSASPSRRPTDAPRAVARRSTRRLRDGGERWPGSWRRCAARARQVARRWSVFERLADGGPSSGGADHGRGVQLAPASSVRGEACAWRIVASVSKTGKARRCARRWRAGDSGAPRRHSPMRRREWWLRKRQILRSHLRSHLRSQREP